jgi:hypothetical protein
VEFERTTTVGLGADAAFARIADPLRIPEYVPVVSHVGSDAEDGVPDEAAAAAARPVGLGEAHFLADAGTRRVEWGRPGSPYAGSMTIEAGTASTSRLTVRLTTRDDVDPAKVEEVLDQALRGLRRILSGH